MTIFTEEESKADKTQTLYSEFKASQDVLRFSMDLPASYSALNSLLHEKGFSIHHSTSDYRRDVELGGYMICLSTSRIFPNHYFIHSLEVNLLRTLRSYKLHDNYKEGIPCFEVVSSYKKAIEKINEIAVLASNPTQEKSSFFGDSLYANQDQSVSRILNMKYSKPIQTIRYFSESHQVKHND